MKTYKIETTHRVHIDSYTEGEGEQINIYTLDKEIKAKTPKRAIEKYFDTVLNYNLNWSNIYLPHVEEEEEEKNILQYSVLVDVENCGVCKKAIDLWEKGEIVL